MLLNKYVNMNNSVCIFTLCSGNYIKESIISLLSFKNNITTVTPRLFIVCIDPIPNSIIKEIFNQFSIQIIFHDDIISYNIDDIRKKYHKTKDYLRWSSKPSCLLYFLSMYDKVFYIDNDIYFINKADFILEYVNKGICLTKHNRCINPFKNKIINNKINYSYLYYKQFNLNQFKCLFTDGFFNAGFIGANNLSIKALEWWADMVLYNCSITKQEGIFLDQKYLDILALEYNDITTIINHNGCNISHWNILEQKIEAPIFFHFSGGKTHQQIHPLLIENYTIYINKIQSI
jgi:hypothetical protein